MFNAADLLRNFLPKELIPPFTSAPLADALQSLPDVSKLSKPYSKLAYHSIPQSKGFRRLVSILNPLHQLSLAQVLESNAADLLQGRSDSTISLSAFTIDGSSERVSRRAFPVENSGVERMVRAAGLRFVLRTDLSRYYQTIYTHSIPWAIHGKSAAKKDRSPALYGNLIDTCVRNCQDQQTLGIPVGPRSSDLIAETVGSALDRRLQEKLGPLKGTRYVDDFHLYFRSRADAENALATLGLVAKNLELELNPSKTEIAELPELIEPPWLTDVRAMHLRSDVGAQRFDLLALFNTAFKSLRRYPTEPVLKYVVKQTLGAAIHQENWDVYESLLCHTIMADPATLPVVTQILLQYFRQDYAINEDRIRSTLSEIVDYHGKLNHGFEVAWAIWLFSLLRIQIPEAVAT